jgi:hypothetical protein
LLLLAALAVPLLGVPFVLNSSTLRGADLFGHGFEAAVRKELSTGALRSWAESKLGSTDGLQDEQNVRLKQAEIPSALRQLRKWSEPSAVLVFGSKEKRWVFLRVKWREAFVEWGIMFTDRFDEQFDRESRYRKLQPGVYTFYE